MQVFELTTFPSQTCEQRVIQSYRQTTPQRICHYHGGGVRYNVLTTTNGMGKTLSCKHLLKQRLTVWEILWSQWDLQLNPRLTECHPVALTNCATIQFMIWEVEIAAQYSEYTVLLKYNNNSKIYFATYLRLTSNSQANETQSWQTLTRVDMKWTLTSEN